MNEFEDLLQERLQQLENGRPPEDCLADLPEEVAASLKLAAALHTVDVPARSEETVKNQRTALLEIAAKEIEDHSQPAAQPSPIHKLKSTMLVWIRGWTAFEWAGAAVLLPVLILLLFAAFYTLLTPPPEIADVPDPSPAPGITQESTSDPETAAPYPPPTTAAIPQTPAAVAAADDPPTGGGPAHQAFAPIVSNPLLANPQTATIHEIKGVVEVQEGDGTWTAVAKTETLQAGQRVRTGALSQATLSFYDGSQAQLGAHSELSIDQLDAQRPADGFRTVVLTQWLGESSHDVQFRNDSGSLYQVKTPTGSGIARGTSFRVFVGPDLLSRYVVTEGRVSVTAVNITVSVIAGQLTTIPANAPPREPAFYISGEGEVSQTGDVWTIAGQSFQTDNTTIIVGNPQVGDLVRVEGHLLPDGTKLADLIILLRRAPQNSFTLTGRVEATGSAAWTISGQSMVVNEATTIAGDIEVGDLVTVEGILREGGTLLAHHIRLAEDTPGLPFTFTGVVQATGDEMWTISGLDVLVNDETTIAPELAVGDVVVVNGWILEDDSKLATSIQPATTEEEFSFTGSVESIDPWVVAGISFETRAWTEIASDIAVGDRVRVSGIILEDGTWVALEINLLDAEEGLQLTFVGTVESIDPWVVAGFPLVVDGNTHIAEGIGVGDLVRVVVALLPDGTWVTTAITPLQLIDEGMGCLSATAIVVAINNNEIILDNWPSITLSDSLDIPEDLEPDSVIQIYFCVSSDGSITIINIIVIYQIQPVIIVPPSPPGGGDDDDDDDDDDSNAGNGRVTICHYPPGNPSERHTITVGRKAWEQEHSKHGDTLGPCD